MIVEGKQKIWADYQKDIPDDHYYYVRSCIRQRRLGIRATNDPLFATAELFVDS
mgnify:CR=1 FL=1